MSALPRASVWVIFPTRMRVLRQVTLLFIAGLVLAAPMLCLQFCELQRHIARPRTSLAEMARLHALSLAERKAQHHHHDDAPLTLLKQMVNSVTEFLTTLGVAISVAMIVMWFILPHVRLTQPLLAVPTPPPRPHSIYPSFAL